MKQYTVIDLFAGAGGLSYGFLQTGRFQIVAAVENNDDARKTYQKNIASYQSDFLLINNVIGCDFSAINRQLGGIDIVIGGPPCQGFSNANRQKNHLISLNNGLVKEYFRAIKEIRPIAFVMENVSMLRSDVHRFYESYKDNDEIENLIAQGHSIPKRADSIVIADSGFDGIDYSNVNEIPIDEILFPLKLKQVLSVLYKNINNERRLPNFLKKNRKSIISNIDQYVTSIIRASIAQQSIIDKLTSIKVAVENDNINVCVEELASIIKLQKVLSAIKEIQQNELIGTYYLSEEGILSFNATSYSAIDYVNAILGDEYQQKGSVINAEWYGVPQERHRFVIIGIRKDLVKEEGIALPVEPKQIHNISVGEAILDLQEYDVCYGVEHIEIPYKENLEISNYAIKMRIQSSGVNNHITTRTTETALNRFRAIKQGNNFHSLATELKSTYSKPERTQNTIYLRLDPSKPSGTVVNVRKSMWIHPILDRAITIREAARLQSFPDKFIFMGSKDSQYQQVGNAVPPLLAQGIALKLLENIEK